MPVLSIQNSKIWWKSRVVCITGGYCCSFNISVVTLLSNIKYLAYVASYLTHFDERWGRAAWNNSSVA